jgi:hypothetical protein
MLKSFIRYQRPAKIFDPSNPEHRQLFYKFQKSQSWAHCPYQWAIDDDSLDIVHCMSKKLVAYYLNAEFVAKKPQKAQKTLEKNVFKIKDLQPRKKVAK